MAAVAVAMHQSEINRAQRQANLHLREVADLQKNGPQQLQGQMLLTNAALAVPAPQHSQLAISQRMQQVLEMGSHRLSTLLFGGWHS